MNFLVDLFHGKMVHPRRVQVLADFVVDQLPQGANVLDVGCGSGELAALILHQRSDVKITGIDTLVRPDTAIPSMQFDGENIPAEENAYDCVMLIDVLHHTLDPGALLKECLRVGRTICLKDHLRNGLFAYSTLKAMDYVGNARYGVSLPNNYLSRLEWHALFDELNVSIDYWNESLNLYKPPVTWFCDRSLHFFANLSNGSRSADSGPE